MRTNKKLKLKSNSVKGEGKHSNTQRLPCYNKETDAPNTKNKLVNHHLNTDARYLTY